MKTLRWAILLAALVMAVPASAQKGETLKGKAAPEFTAGESITSQPPAKTLAECKSEVVLIKLWGVN